MAAMCPPDLFAPSRRATASTAGKRYCRSKRFDDRQARSETQSAAEAMTRPTRTIAIFQRKGIGFRGGRASLANGFSSVTDDSGVGVAVEKESPCDRAPGENAIRRIDISNAATATREGIFFLPKLMAYRARPRLSRAESCAALVSSIPSTISWSRTVINSMPARMPRTRSPARNPAKAS